MFVNIFVKKSIYLTNPFFRTIFVPEKLTTRLFIDILISTADEEEEERRRRSSSGSPFSPRLYSPENNTGIRFSARPPLLRPSRLTSWVAGGYWGSPAATPGDTGQMAASLSRASSQSSGFASASGICLLQCLLNFGKIKISRYGTVRTTLNPVAQQIVIICRSCLYLYRW